ncbi:MAG: hypothetical protein SGARI_005376, partial [Bacillariaceae sp.]
MNAQANASGAEGQDDVWGKVIEAVEDDSTWAGHLDDFSISVCRKSLPITPVVREKMTKKDVTPATGPVPRIDLEIATPTGNRSFVMSNVDVSPLAMPITGSPVKKKKAKRSSKQKKAQTNAPWDDAEQDFSMPLNDHAVPIEIKLVPNDENDEPPIHPHAQESPEDAFHRSFGDLDFGKADEEEKKDTAFDLDGSEHKFHKSLGDIPSQDLEDLMANP